jgi:hypothetical protein
MNKFFLCTSFIVLCYLNLKAQKVYEFKLSPIQTRVSNSLYNSLAVLDYRADTTSMGFIHTGMSELYTRVRPATPVSSQYKALFNTTIDNTATDGQLLLQIRRLLFAERANKGYFNMRAILYSKIGKYYEIVGRIDTLVSKTSPIDPTNGILKLGDKIMTDFLLENLKVKPSDPILSYGDVLNITNVEKNELPLYNRDQYIDGLYLNYRSFNNQMPDRQITVNGDDLNSGEIRTIEGGGITQKVKANKVYAMVYKGLPYVVSEGLYYPLKKVNNDFFFVGKARAYVVPGDELVSDIAGDITPFIVFSSLPTATFQVKIDYANGAFIRLKKVLDAKGNPVK